MPTGTKASNRMSYRRQIRVFLVDDHELIRRGLRDCMEAEQDLVVVGEAGTAQEATSRIPAIMPEVVVLDVRLPDGNGIEVCRDLRSIHPEIRFLILTTFSDDEALFDAIVAGADGYVLKDTRGDSLIESIRRVAEGQSLLDPAVTKHVLARLRRFHESADQLSVLTRQEREILDLIGKGMTNRQIAAEMHLAEKTVKNYVSGLLSKLGMSHRTEAAIYITRLNSATMRFD
jgi:two-component system, NarL family, response regulator DevR